MRIMFSKMKQITLLAAKWNLYYLHLVCRTLHYKQREGGKRWREREGGERGRLNGPLDQNDSCEEGSENKQGFRELLAALVEAITIIIIVIMFTVIIRCLFTASPLYSTTDEGGKCCKSKATVRDPFRRAETGRITLNASICHREGGRRAKWMKKHRGTRVS